MFLRSSGEAGKLEKDVAGGDWTYVHQGFSAHAVVVPLYWALYRRILSSWQQTSYIFTALGIETVEHHISLILSFENFWLLLMSILTAVTFPWDDGVTSETVDMCMLTDYIILFESARHYIPYIIL